MEINESDRALTFSDELPRTLQEVYNDLANQFQVDKAPSELSPITVNLKGLYFTIPGDGNIRDIETNEVVGIENEN
jgi:hypothetical protein